MPPEHTYLTGGRLGAAYAPLLIGKQHDDNPANKAFRVRAFDSDKTVTKERLDQRRIIFHGGPTNSGKTYNALQRLREAKNGLYLGPLRLLAAEIYEELTTDGLYTNLFTGQEKRDIAFSTHTSATVEMSNPNTEYDVVVIDEIQMIADWADGGTPEGDPSLTPDFPVFPAGSQIGVPDLRDGERDG